MQPTFHSIPPFSISLQPGFTTALMLASENGLTEAINALLTIPGINVNQINVSLKLLVYSYLSTVKKFKRVYYMFPSPFPYLLSTLSVYVIRLPFDPSFY